MVGDSAIDRLIESASFQETLRQTEALCSPPLIDVPGSHASHKVVADAAKNVIVEGLLVTEAGDPSQKEMFSLGLAVPCVAALTLAREGFPTFWCDQHMLAAVRHTVAPPETKLADIRWPRRAIAVMLPRGCGITLMGEDVAALVTARLDKHAAPELAGWDGVKFFFGAVAKDRQTWRIFGVSSMLESDTTGDVAGCDISRLCVSLLLALQARPGLVTSDDTARWTTKKGRVVHAPVWIGKNYGAVRKIAGGGTHASPRMHWRRGHFRMQPFGPQRAARRVTWIEPLLVSAGNA